MARVIRVVGVEALVGGGRAARVILAFVIAVIMQGLELLQGDFDFFLFFFFFSFSSTTTSFSSSSSSTSTTTMTTLTRHGRVVFILGPRLQNGIASRKGRRR